MDGRGRLGSSWCSMVDCVRSFSFAPVSFFSCVLLAVVWIASLFARKEIAATCHPTLMTVCLGMYCDCELNSS